MRKLLIILLLVFMVIPEGSLSAGYSKQQIKSAQKVMVNVKQMAKVFEEDGRLVVEFHDYLYPYDMDQRLRFVRIVADADAVLHNGPRSIYFYNPGDKQIAQADRLNGVRLK